MANCGITSGGDDMNIKSKQYKRLKKYVALYPALTVGEVARMIKQGV
jgi:hypothetical protein